MWAVNKEAIDIFNDVMDEDVDEINKSEKKIIGKKIDEHFANR